MIESVQGPLIATAILMEDRGSGNGNESAVSGIGRVDLARVHQRWTKIVIIASGKADTMIEIGEILDSMRHALPPETDMSAAARWTSTDSAEKTETGLARKGLQVEEETFQ